MEFHNQNITDILLVLAEASGTSILPDETVTGTASFYFSESSIEDALTKFLSTYNLYFEKNNNFITVSKIKISYDSSKALCSVKTNNTKIETVLRKLAEKINKTILFDLLPSSPISLDIVNLPVENILNICIKKFPDYTIEKSESFYYVKKLEEKQSSGKRTTDNAIKKDGDFYSINIDKGRLIDILNRLFTLEKIEYSIFLQSDMQLENLHFTNKDFNTILNLILEHGNADYIKKNGIYYIVDLQKKGIATKLKITELINLKWISTQDLTNLLPSELTSSVGLKMDKANNTILLNGFKEELQPVKAFIETIDIPLGGMQYAKIDIKYLNAKDMISLIPAKMVQQAPVLIPSTNSILFAGSEESINNITAFIGKLDTKKTSIPIKLKYIKTDALLKNIPPSINKEDIIDAGFPNLLFYTGTEENYQLFLHELNLIDKPQPQLKYQLLVIQYTDGKANSLNSSINIASASDSDNFAFNGELSNIMNLKFDVISKFGYQFAANLNNRIANNTANVFTDTTLTAISGQDVKFQNTDTYRYIEYTYDNSSTARSSSTQQITSGLIVNLNGWVSGDNMITMSVNATVSKQNSDSTSSSTTSLPSTSERVITTQVRTMSGEPVVISGLIKEDTIISESRVPILGRIPGLGLLFKHKTKSKEKNEIVIYIVPHLIQDNGNIESDTLNIERYYKKFIGNSYE